MINKIQNLIKEYSESIKDLKRRASVNSDGEDYLLGVVSGYEDILEDLSEIIKYVDI